MLKWLVVLCIASVWSDTDCPVQTTCRAEYNRCYKLISTGTEFDRAETNCVSLGGHLASIRSEEENTDVLTMAKSHFIYGSLDFWIGAEGGEKWSWSDGSEWNYTNWLAGEPQDANNNGAIILDSGKWRSSNPNSLKPYVCALPYSSGTTMSTATCMPSATYSPPVTYQCDSAWTYYEMTDSCYGIVKNCDYADCKKQCEDLGSHLTSIHSTAENYFITGLTTTGYNSTETDATWIGLYNVYDPVMRFVWEDGSEFNYKNWFETEPSSTEQGKEDCVQLYSDFEVNIYGYTKKFTWNDLLCSKVMRRAVCKKPVNRM